MAQIVALATPAKRLSVQFREDVERAVITEADNQFNLIALTFEDGKSGVIYDWGCRRTIRWSNADAESVMRWSDTDGKRFCYEVGRFFLHEKEEGDEAE